MRNQQGLFNFIRKTSFLKFFITWIISMFVCGLFYWVTSMFLQNMNIELAGSVAFNITGLFKSIYASFLIATIFGLELIRFPPAIMIVAYVQFVFSIFIVIVLLDKLFQRFIHPHYHQNMMHEKQINTMMLMMSIFRSDIDKLRHEFKAKIKHHVQIKEIEAIIDGLYVVFLDIEKMFSDRNINKHLIKDRHYWMLTTNIEDSLEKLSKFIEFLDMHKIAWKDNSIDFWLNYILNTADKIAANVDVSHIKSPKVIVAIENIKEYTESIRKLL